MNPEYELQIRKWFEGMTKRELVDRCLDMHGIHSRLAMTRDGVRVYRGDKVWGWVHLIEYGEDPTGWVCGRLNSLNGEYGDGWSVKGEGRFINQEFSWETAEWFSSLEAGKAALEQRLAGLKEGNLK